jgi:hypothetical protein
MRKGLAILIMLAISGCSLISVKGAAYPGSGADGTAAQACPHLVPPPPIDVHYRECQGYAACFSHEQFDALSRAINEQNSFDKEMRQ